MEKENGSLKLKTQYNSNHPVIKLPWIKQILGPRYCWLCESYVHCHSPLVMDNRWVSATSLKNESDSFNKIWKLESKQPLNESIAESTEFSTDSTTMQDTENGKVLKKKTLERSLRKYFMNEDLLAIKSRRERRHAHTTDEWDKSLIDFTAGSLAGIAQVYASQPFDTLKVKQQTFPKVHSSMLKCFLYTYRTNGIVRGLYAGSLPAVVSSLAENSVLFTAYGACQEMIAFTMNVNRTEELSALGNACAGFLAAFFSSLAMCPTEVIKCKLQAVHEMKHYINKQSTAVPKKTIKLAKDIFVNEGIGGFYRGLSSTVAREMPGYFFFFGSYEATREFFARPTQNKDDIGALRTMFAGAVGGVTSWTITYPIDVIKTRIQIKNLKGSMLSVGSDIVRREGFLAFYNGLLPTLLRTIPATATLFLVYEYSKKVLTEQFL